MFSVARFLPFLLLVVGAIASRGEDLSQQVLNETNFARTQPQRYAQVLLAKMSGPRSNSRDVAEAVRFLQGARPLAPLMRSTGMSQSARGHVADIGPRGGRGHYGTGGSSPFTRMNRYGQWMGSAGENIYYGTRDARGIVCALIVDTGVSGRKHRQNIFSSSFTVAGVANGPHAGFGAMCVMDFAGGYIEGGSSIARL